MELSSSFNKKSIDSTLILIGFCFIIVSGYFTWSTSYVHDLSEPIMGRITTCSGGCKHKSPSDYFWLSGQTGMPVVNKSLVYAPINTKTVIQLISGNKLTLYPNTIVQINISAERASIDIISGKIEFKKVTKSEGREQITINGAPISNGMMVSPEPFVEEISAEPERLKAIAQDRIFLKNKEASTKIDIENGFPPFELEIEDSENFKKIKSNSNTLNYSFQESGIFTLKIKDSNGDVVRKLVQVEDLNPPHITTPQDGDYIFQRNFKIEGDIESDSEILLTKSGEEFFKGNITNMPRELPIGKYELIARKSIESQFSNWSKPVAFTIVETVQPIILTNEKIFINQANLKWKRAIPVIHTLIIKIKDTGEELRYVVPDEEFQFHPDISGKYYWTVFPSYRQGITEKPIYREFSLLNLNTIRTTPRPNEKFLSEETQESVLFEWTENITESIESFLEISSDYFSKEIDIKNLDQLELDLKTNKTYRWRMSFEVNNKKYSTDYFNFSLTVPQPAPPIKVEEIIIKD